MKVRKIVAGLAAVSMLAVCAAQVAFAADTVGVSAEKVTAAAGSEFTMNVELSDVPAAGISVCDFGIAYDASLVTVTDVTVGAIANKGADGAENFEGVTAFDAELLDGMINITYTTGLEDNAYWITEGGVFCTIKGTVKDTAEAGAVAEFEIGAVDRDAAGNSGTANADIAIGYVTGTAPDYVVTAYDVTVSNGSVTVEGAGDTETTDPDQGGDDVTLFGDTNCDGIVNIADVILLNRGLLGDAEIEPTGKANADVDQNNTLEATDSLNILKLIVELIDSLPV